MTPATTSLVRMAGHVSCQAAQNTSASALPATRERTAISVYIIYYSTIVLSFYDESTKLNYTCCPLNFEIGKNCEKRYFTRSISINTA